MTKQEKRNQPKAIYKEICKDMVKATVEQGLNLLLNVDIYRGQRNYILRRIYS